MTDTRTDALIGRLAADPASGPRRSIETRLGLAAALGLALVAPLVLGLIGARADPGGSLLTPADALRMLGAAAIAAAAFRLACRLARPGTPALCPVTVACGLVLLAVTAAAVAASGTGLRLGGSPAGVLPCTEKVVLLAMLPLAAVLAALRRGAPTRPAAAGAAAGALAGALAAAGFAMACPMNDPAQVALAYGAAIVLLMALGAVAGRRLLAW